tara:strand:- start:99 stop:731 length:633 start_codon:yes stop_codon:yes gene_type:complete
MQARGVEFECAVGTPPSTEIGDTTLSCTARTPLDCGDQAYAPDGWARLNPIKGNCEPGIRFIWDGNEEQQFGGGMPCNQGQCDTYCYPNDINAHQAVDTSSKRNLAMQRGGVMIDYGENVRPKAFSEYCATCCKSPLNQNNVSVRGFVTCSSDGDCGQDAYCLPHSGFDCSTEDPTCTRAAGTPWGVDGTVGLGICINEGEVVQSDPQSR